MPKYSYKKYSKDDQQTLAIWAADCAERVLHLFETEATDDMRPRNAIAKCREWANTGVFKMSVIREASLNSHRAAREVVDYEAACMAAHAAGQAVATAHVTQHAYGAAYYALKAIVASSSNGYEDAMKEAAWERDQLPLELRDEIMKRIIIKKEKNKTLIKIDKENGI